MVRRAMFLLCVLSLLFLPTVSLFANEAESIVGAEEFMFMDIPEVTIASAKSESIKAAPANVYVITGAQMKARGYRTLGDLLKDLPGVYVGSKFAFGANVAIIRGFNTGLDSNNKRLKLMIDGMVFDSKDGTSTPYSYRFPVDGIERVEFILGPYAALYGRNSFSGVLNVVTKAASDIDGGQVSVMYGNYDRNQESLVVGDRVEDLGLDVYLSVFRDELDSLNLADESDEYSLSARIAEQALNGGLGPAGWNVASEGLTWSLGQPGVPTEHYIFWKSTDLYLKTDHDSGLGFDLEFNETNFPEIGANGLPPAYYASTHDSSVNNKLLNVRLRYEIENETGLSFKTAFIYQHAENYAKNIYLTLPLTFKWYGSESESVMLDNKFTYQFNEDHSVYFGLALEQVTALPFKSSARGSNVDKPSWDVDEEIRTDYLVASLQGDFTFGKFTAVPGVMYENAENHEDVLLPRFSGIFQINDDNVVKYIYGTGFLAPDPLSGADQVIGGGQGIRGNTAIGPELMISHELQYLLDISERFRLNTSIFKQKLEDKITTVALSGDPIFNETWDNTGKLESKGFEIGLDANPVDNIKMFASYGYVRGKTAGVNGLYGMAKNHFKVGVNFLLVDQKLNLYIHDMYIDRVENWNGDNYKFPTVNLVDVNLKTTDEFNEDWEFSIGITNLFDKLYRDTPTQYDPGFYKPNTGRRRMWTVKASYNF